VSKRKVDRHLERKILSKHLLSVGHGGEGKSGRTVKLLKAESASAWGERYLSAASEAAKEKNLERWDQKLLVHSKL